MPVPVSEAHQTCKELFDPFKEEAPCPTTHKVRKQAEQLGEVPHQGKSLVDRTSRFSCAEISAAAKACEQKKYDPPILPEFLFPSLPDDLRQVANATVYGGAGGAGFSVVFGEAVQQKSLKLAVEGAFRGAVLANVLYSIPELLVHADPVE